MEGKVKIFLLEKGIEKKDVKVHFSGNKEVDKLINDIEHYPHAYVLACCFIDRQVEAEKAWSIPHHIKKVLGDFSIQTLLSPIRDQYVEIFKKDNLYRFNEKMADVSFSTVNGIHDI